MSLWASITEHFRRKAHDPEATAREERVHATVERANRAVMKADEVARLRRMQAEQDVLRDWWQR